MAEHLAQQVRHRHVRGAHLPQSRVMYLGVPDSDQEARHRLNRCCTSKKPGKQEKIE